jgi:hypothetical protein
METHAIEQNVNAGITTSTALVPRHFFLLLTSYRFNRLKVKTEAVSYRLDHRPRNEPIKKTWPMSRPRLSL